MMIKAIETEYAGHRFRSRLEARWAVLFDRLEIEWEYEPQGYEVGAFEKRSYLPDFHLVESDIWVEVKGRGSSVNWGLMADCIDYGMGLPGSPARLAVVGGIPERPKIFPVLRHRKGVIVEALMLRQGHAESFHGWELGHLKQQLPRVLNSGCSGTGGDSWPGWPDEEQELIAGVDGLWLGYTWGPKEVLIQAFSDARKARFEHGETPRRGAAVVPDYMTSRFWK